MNAEMTTDAHTFVVHADLTKLACDLVLVPTDAGLQVSAPWKGFGQPGKPPGWGNQGVRVTEAIREGAAGQGRLIRWVNTGTVPSLADRRWLLDGVEEALVAAGESVQTTHLNGRARALVGLPLFGTGAGGFDAVRGEVLGEILRTSEEMSARYGYDVVITCWHRSDYAALQKWRLEHDSPFTSMSRELTTEAVRLGKLARNQQLTLFLGAGVSQAAGLPSWDDLISLLAKHSRRYADRTAGLRKISVIDAASLLRRDLEPEQFRLLLSDELSQRLHAISHALLASLAGRQAITTNFDKLYEQACEAAFTDRLCVLPWGRPEPDQPWLLKMHGDIDHEGVVLSREEFLGFAALWQPLASMVQTAMMTRHLLFVGYSLRDENFARLAGEVGLLLERLGRDQETGTVLTLHEDPIAEAMYGKNLKFVPLGGAEAARLVEIFLDCVGMHAASGERSYLLDPRYRSFVRPADEAVVSRLRELGKAVEESQGELGVEVREFLNRYGYPRDHDG